MTTEEQIYIRIYGGICGLIYVSGIEQTTKQFDPKSIDQINKNETIKDWARRIADDVIKMKGLDDNK